MPAQLIDTVAEILELRGAAVEKDGERLDALLPPEVSSTLQIPEQTALYFDAGQSPPDGELVTFQSDFVDRLFALMQDAGNYANLSLKDLYLKQGAKGSAEQRFTVLNGLGRSLDANARHLSYAQLNLKYTAVADEKKEGVVSVIINEQTLADASVMATHLSWAESVERAGHLDLQPQPFRSVYAAACRSAEPLIHLQLAEFHRSLNRRLQRDVHRLTQYYRSLTEEIHRKIKRRGLEGKDRQDEESRIRATELELERKIIDQREKYALKVRVEPISLLRLFMPAMVVGFEIRFRKIARELPLVWNPLVKDFEAVPCQSCATGLYGFNVCEDKVHVLCVDCFKCAGCGRHVCHACHPGNCPKCAVTY